MNAPEACSFCGLPLPRPWWRKASTSAAPARDSTGVARQEFCCYGCRLAANLTAGEQTTAGSAGTWVARLAWSGFFTVNVMAVSMALWTADVYALEGGPDAQLARLMHDLFRWLCLLFSLPVAWLLLAPLARGAADALRGGRLGTDALLVAGVAAAYAFSLDSVLRTGGPIYFEVGNVVLLAVSWGRWLEARGKLRATAALESLAEQLPADALRVSESGSCLVPLAALAPGDHVQIVAGARVPTDCTLRGGSALVDEQLLTGESRPVLKQPDDPLWGGTLNLDGDLLAEVVAPASAGAVQRIARAMQQARLQKGAYQKLADRVAGAFFPVIVLVALATLLWHARAEGLQQGVLAALAVVLIACPCALALATPLAVSAALGQACRRQVLFRSGDAIERLARVRAIAFDKTGTLTLGVPQARLAWHDPTVPDERVLELASLLARVTTHPLARAISDLYAGAHRSGINDSPLRECRTLAGQGVVGSLVDGSRLRLGSVAWLQSEDCVWPTAAAQARDLALQQGESLAVFALGDAVCGLFVLQEQLRPELAECLRECNALGLHVAVLTGDHAARGARLAEELRVAVTSALAPADKPRELARIRDERGPVAMVGDGINDGPALAAAEVGLALACGADVAREAADVCLLSDSLARVPWAVQLARRTVLVIRQNLFWTFVYNVAGVGLAASGRLNPIWAAAAMVLSSLAVVANSLRLARAPAEATTAVRKAAEVDSALTTNAADKDSTPTVLTASSADAPPALEAVA